MAPKKCVPKSGAMGGHWEQQEIIGDHTEPYGSTLDHTGLYGTIGDHNGSNDTKGDLMDMWKTIPDQKRM